MSQKIEFTKAKGLFITGTDTGVGKTLVTGAIANWFLRKVKGAGVFKPIATGCESRREGLVSPDAEFLSHWSQSTQPLDVINPVRYSDPLAPLAAAERTKNPIDWDTLTLGYDNIAKASRLVLVEGIGGAMVPLEKDYLVLDMMCDMDLPVLIVARSTLGTLNHTIMTIEICRSRGLNIAGVILNGYQTDSEDLSEESNPRIIFECTGIRVVVIIPYDKKSCVEKGRLGDDVISAIDLCRWESML